MKTGPPTPEELGHILSFRNLMKGCTLDDVSDEEIAHVIRIAIEVDRRRYRSEKDLARKKAKGIR